jgi:NAD(P)-dependent dehydrogenase (short-subunit alcohol dehydrogenase family)
MGLLAGKVAVITGAGRGIGRAEALLFAREGARVVVNDLGCDVAGRGADPAVAAAVVAEIAAAGGTAVASSESVASREGAEAAVARAVAAFGRLDVMVCNAGIVGRASLLALGEQIWQPVVATHLSGTLWCLQAAARQLIEQAEGGRIVTTASTAGVLGGLDQCCHAAAVAGVVGLTRAAAVELQRHQITVNALAPVARTRMTGDDEAESSLGAELGPEHVATVALLLASPLCRQRTGLVLAVTGPHLSAYRAVATRGCAKPDLLPWTPAEIDQSWDTICKA